MFLFNRFISCLDFSLIITEFFRFLLSISFPTLQFSTAQLFANTAVKVPLQFLSTQVDLLSEWPEGVAMLIEDGLLISEDKKVRSLHHSCRIAIRGFLRQPIRESVKQLPLPKKVRKTLVFHYLPVYDFNHDLAPFTFNKRSISDHWSPELG